MNKMDFLNSIYLEIEVGMDIIKPKVTSKILKINSKGNIYYRIGTENQKFVSQKELEDIFDRLVEKPVSTSDIRSVVPKSKPCNVTTIKWLLSKSKYIKVRDDGFSKLITSVR